MARVTVTKLKQELEKFKSLDDKKTYLESALKTLKSLKLKKAVEKLLEEVEKHLEHEGRFSKETPLEEKLSDIKEISPEVSAINGFSTIKYVPRREQTSPLEKEVGIPLATDMTAASPGVKYAPPSATYEHQRKIESMRFYLSEQQQLVSKFTPDAWQAMPEEKKRQIFDVVKESLGISEVGSADYTRVVDYISNVFSQGKKPEEKYKTRFS